MMRAIYRAAARPLTAHELTEKLRVRGIKIRRGKLTPHGYEYILQFPTGLQKTFWSLEEAVKAATLDESLDSEESKAFQQKIQLMKLVEILKAKGISIERVTSSHGQGCYQVTKRNGDREQFKTLEDAIKSATLEGSTRTFHPSSKEDRPRTAHIPSPVDVKIIPHRVSGNRGIVIKGYTVIATIGNIRRIVHVDSFTKAKEISDNFKNSKTVQDVNRVYGKYTKGKRT